jgi:hypothetical protein
LQAKIYRNTAGSIAAVAYNSKQDTLVLFLKAAHVYCNVSSPVKACKPQYAAQLLTVNLSSQSRRPRPFYRCADD